MKGFVIFYLQILIILEKNDDYISLKQNMSNCKKLNTIVLLIIIEIIQLAL